MKTIIILLLLLPLVYAMEECLETVTVTEIPCQLITTWDYPNDCGSYSIVFYNSTAGNVGEWYLDNYSDTGRCNTTFNFTIVDSYIYNISSGDSGRVIVEVDEKMNIALAIVLSTFAALFIVIGIVLWWRNQNARTIE